MIKEAISESLLLLRVLFFILWKIRCGELQKPYFGLCLDGVFLKVNIDDGISFLLMLLKESFIPKFSQSFIPEIIGMIVIIILTLSWLKNTLNKKSSKDDKVKKETAIKPTIKMTVLYLMGFLIFGLFFVRAIELL
jgi:hypothetical protein